MEAIRKILDVKDHSLRINLPNNFEAEKVEVIILPLDKQAEISEKAILRGKLNLSSAQYSDFHENIKKSREE